MLIVNNLNILIIFDDNKSILAVKDIIWNKFGFNTPFSINKNDFLSFDKKKLIKNYNIIIIFTNKNNIVENSRTLELIYNKYLKIEVIIICSHSNFKNLKRYVKININNKYYHINNKPLDYIKLNDILLKIKIKLNNYQKTSQETFILSKYSDNILSLSKKNNFNNSKRYYRIFAIEICNSEIIHFKNVVKLINEYINKTNHIYFLFIDNQQIFLLLIYDSIFILKNKCIEICNHISFLIFQNIKIYISIGISKCIYSELKNTQIIHNGFLEAKKALNFCFNFGYNTIIFYEDIKDSKKISDFFIKLYSDISNSFSLNDKNLIVKNIKKLIYVLNDNFASKKESIFQCKVIMILLVKKVYEITNNISDVDVFQKNFFNEIENVFFLQDIYNILIKIINIFYKILLSSKKNIILLQIFKAKDFIKKNYHNSNLSLNNVTDHIEISTSYFSNIFKSKTGMTFVEYLTKIRIEKAKQLFLLTDKLIYEIAYEVGFSDAHYFSSIFKKNVSITPREYKTNFGKK